ncbi:MAG: DUF1294 domain-containing protein [Clostridia bacterium]|nr:DUF1294 domain-containing protein [Clostridia bacterium]
MVITIIRICVAVYYAAVNVFGFVIMNIQKKGMDNEETCNRVSDGKIFFAALLGGAVGIYIAMFVLKYKLKSVAFMVLTPVIAAAHICFIIFGYTQNFAFISPASSTLALAFKSRSAKFFNLY